MKKTSIYIDEMAELRLRQLSKDKRGSFSRIIQELLKDNVILEVLFDRSKRDKVLNPKVRKVRNDKGIKRGSYKRRG